MKNKLLCVLIVLTLSATMIMPCASAKVGDVVGKALHTDIVAYINNYAIPSYAVNGESCIVAEDLRNFGFDVTWNGTNRTLSITKSKKPYMNQMQFSKTESTGSFFANVLQTDIVTYAEGVRIPSYAINGYTMVPMEKLTMLGQIVWNPGLWILEMTVSGFPKRAGIQEISKGVFNNEYFNLIGQTYSAIKAGYGKPETPVYWEGGVAYPYKNGSVYLFFENRETYAAEPKANEKCTFIMTYLKNCVNGMGGKTFTKAGFEQLTGTKLVEKGYMDITRTYNYEFVYQGRKHSIDVMQNNKITAEAVINIR